MTAALTPGEDDAVDASLASRTVPRVMQTVLGVLADPAWFADASRGGSAAVVRSIAIAEAMRPGTLPARPSRLHHLFPERGACRHDFPQGTAREASPHGPLGYLVCRLGGSPIGARWPRRSEQSPSGHKLIESWRCKTKEYVCLGVPGPFDGSAVGASEL